MKNNTFLTVTALAGMMFVGQSAMAQQSADQKTADRQTSSGTSDASAAQGDDKSKSQDSAQADSSDSAATAAGARPGQSARGQSSKKMDQKFVEFVSTNDQFEIQASQIAEEQAQDDQIKQMARQLRQDHEQSSKQLQQVAQQAGIQVSQQLKPHQQAMLQELKQIQGEEFDKAFLYDNVAGHTKAVLKYRDAVRDCQNPQLKQFAQQMLPKIRQHLQHAQQLAQWDEAQAETAGARERATSPGSSDTKTGTRSGTTDANAPGSTKSQNQ